MIYFLKNSLWFCEFCDFGSLIFRASGPASPPPTTTTTTITTIKINMRKLKVVRHWQLGQCNHKNYLSVMRNKKDKILILTDKYKLSAEHWKT